MIIGFPTTGERGPAERVHNHFGSAPFFTLYDTASQTYKVVSNTHAEHEHGTCQPLDLVAQHGMNALFTSGMGKRAVESLNSGGVKVYRFQGETVAQALHLFEAGQREELTPQSACTGHNHEEGAHSLHCRH